MVTTTNAAGGRGAEIARLFTTTTLLSLGGAYAVVPWALDESVARGWLDTGERFTALAMGEATPGPLILVVTFIGFMAGWRAGGESMLPAGLAGACQGLGVYARCGARRGDHRGGSQPDERRGPGIAKVEDLIRQGER